MKFDKKRLEIVGWLLLTSIVVGLMFTLKEGTAVFVILAFQLQLFGYYFDEE